MPSPYIIGICGASASGKTAFIDQLTQRVGQQLLCLISMDDYYKPIEQQPRDAQGVVNFDQPQCLNHNLLISHLKQLANGQTITQPQYTFNNPQATPQMLTFEPKPIIVLEGIFTFYFDQLRNLLDLKLFIDAEEHLKLTRRIKRDQTERGYPLSDILYRYENHVAPNYLQYIKPYQKWADLIIQNNHSFDNALQVLEGFIKHRLENS